MASAALDHLVVAAQTLEVGARYLEARLGVRLQPGGRHLAQGTHNLLLRLGEVYLELIAPDPEATVAPAWFGLADPALLASLAQPRLVSWVARTEDLAALLAATGYPLIPRPAARGALRWHFGFSADGGLLADGLLPYLIEWQGAHPLAALSDAGLRLLRLTGAHPRAATINQQLAQLGLAQTLQVVSAPRPQLQALIVKPDGTTVLLD